LSLVRLSLKERGILLKNAPHLVKKLEFIVPCYSLWDTFFYGAGLKIYNLLSGKYDFGKSWILSKQATLEKLPNIKRENLRGGVLYLDGQFDDTRLLINLAATAIEQGAMVLNYAKVFELTKNEHNKVNGVNFQDTETGEIFQAKAKVVINAAGAFSDSIRKLSDEKSKNIIALSQGIHLVFDREFLRGETALMIPKTSDGRVLFAIPWQDKTLIGTTDTPIDKADLEPKAFESEIEFILEAAKFYLAKPPTRADILSVFVGIRPLVKSNKTKNTARLSRDHTIEIDESTLLTITGGKWTTYRRMAEDAVNQAIKIADLPEKTSPTKDLKIHGFCENAENFGDLAIYGTDAEKILEFINENPKLSEKLHKNLPFCAAEIVWAVRNEMAQTVEDILARRTRALFLDAKAAVEIAPKVAQIMADELRKDKSWIDGQIREFNNVAKNYFVT
ncbi:MAG: glycerol-3-phosphate dehydrogenase/oxidase, partial [Acidobacteriota bacterium]|nr:glycerol-3-phosphate dehydrogenase/oxidase [Acidobacteriota bacterium]